MNSISFWLKRGRCAWVAVWGLLALAASAAAQEEAPSDSAAPPAERPEPGEATAKDEANRAAIEKLGWTREGTVSMGQWADIAVPKGYRFTAGDGTRQFLRMLGNLVGTSEQGLLAPESLDWFIVFDFDPVGYVKDDEKNALDADAILKQKKEAEKSANEARRDAGLPPLFITGWVVKPHYDEATHNLEWGLGLRNEEGGESVNYNLKLLGRHGVMDATLVCDPSQLDRVLPETRRLIKGFAFRSGESYAEYRKGDKIAQYGLTALVLGSGAALAAKSGLFAVLGKTFGKFFKVIVVAGIALLVGIKKFFGGLFGGGGSRRDRDSGPPPPPPPTV